MRIAIVGLIVAFAGFAVASASETELIIENASMAEVTVHLYGFQTVTRSNMPIVVPWSASKSILSGRARWNLEGIKLSKIEAVTRTGYHCHAKTNEGGTWYIIHGYGSNFHLVCMFSRTPPGDDD